MGGETRGERAKTNARGKYQNRWYSIVGYLSYDNNTTTWGVSLPLGAYNRTRTTVGTATPFLHQSFALQDFTHPFYNHSTGGRARSLSFNQAHQASH